MTSHCYAAELLKSFLESHTVDSCICAAFLPKFTINSSSSNCHHRHCQYHQHHHQHHKDYHHQHTVDSCICTAFLHESTINSSSSNCHHDHDHHHQKPLGFSSTHRWQLHLRWLFTPIHNRICIPVICQTLAHMFHKKI